jgi:hypothetical protein
MQRFNPFIRRRASARRVAICSGLILTAALSAPAAAQGTVTHAPNTQEFGVDAGALIGLGNTSSVQINLPAARARIGYFLNNDSRWSIEPAGALAYSKVEGTPSATVYNLELGALYHFRPPTSLYRGPYAAVGYVRPFIGLNGTSSGGSSSNEFEAGGGLGIKVPWRTDVAFRFEANLGYGFARKAADLGLYAGLSFFSHGGR